MTDDVPAAAQPPEEAPVPTQYNALYIVSTSFEANIVSNSL